MEFDDSLHIVIISRERLRMSSDHDLFVTGQRVSGLSLVEVLKVWEGMQQDLSDTIMATEQWDSPYAEPLLKDFRKVGCDDAQRFYDRTISSFSNTIYPLPVVVKVAYKST